MSVGFYSLEDTEQRTGRSEGDLRNLVKRGALNMVEDDGSVWFSAADVDELSRIKSKAKSESTGAPAEAVPKAEEEIDITEVPIALEPETEQEEDGMARIRSFGNSGITGSHDTSKLKRGTLKAGEGATRCRTFHCKLSDGSLAKMDERINEWVDEDETILIKFVQTTVGIVEGKHAEAHLIISVFY